MIMIHKLYEDGVQTGEIKHKKKRYPLKRILTNAKEIIEYEYFKQIFMGGKE